MNPSGNGLGLFISRKICRSLAGDLLLESKKGEGSKFTMTIGIKKVDTKIISCFEKELESCTIFT